MDCRMLIIFTSVVFEQVWTNQTVINSTQPIQLINNITASTTVKINTSNRQTTTKRSITSAHLNTTVANQCQNGGHLTGGVCLCPDDWSGPTCTTSQFASSKEQCQLGTPNAGIPKSSALCNTITHSFDPSNDLDCLLTLDTININIYGSSVQQKNKLASSTQILTSIPERLTPYNITKAAEITSILLSSDTKMDIAVSAVATVSQLLSASPMKYSDVDHKAIANLTKSLQKLSLQKDSNTLLVQPNMAVQSIKGQTQIRQVQLTSFKGENDTFIPDRIKLDYATHENENLPQHQNYFDLQMKVIFKEAFNKDVGIVLYENDQFFQSQSFKSSLDIKRRVVSANLPENHELNEVELKVPAQSTDSSKSLHNFACVLWHDSKQEWSTKDCVKEMSTTGHATCRCKPNQANINFAILMTFSGNYQYSEALHWISITGCSLSVVGLAITAVYQVVTRKSRGGSPTLLVVNVCLSMTIFYLLFIFGINNTDQHMKAVKFSEENMVPESDHYQEPDNGHCTAVTALLQYFLLATFTWNTLYGANVYLLFKNKVSGTPQWFPKVALAVGWGLPAVIVGISLGSTYRVKEPLGYRQEEFCWLAFLDQKHNFDMRKPMFWGFLLPLVIMLISNTAMLLFFSHNVCRTNPNLNKSRETPLKKKLLSSFSLAVMLGLSWVTGYILLISQEKTLKLILSVVFCLCNTTQGIQIFILFTLKSILNKKPAILDTMHVAQISLHRKTFSLWKVNIPESRETYTSTDLDFSSPP
ncbi:adhesion G-protein coupled receptor G7-like isoform X2 [Xyrauchen texanus]|uniref:adhesion G-protein coupled receptor G7-like isoform X2 n=1 Tax=Xyrauchen texanus TaxID=154827 RepID=UPI00224208D5|nr:adhesion G-protein coupled receptor G7-like isoform X2 [Xyrauchen texanus]